MTVLLFLLLIVMSIVSLFIGVMDIDEDVLIISRLPRLLAILCTGFYS